jgi:NosR/NirI family nitrous oxide reductase transcriptional regulator
MVAGDEVVPVAPHKTRLRWRGWHRWRGCPLHLLRLTVLLLVVFLIRDQHVRWQRTQALLAESPLTLAAVKPFFDDATALSKQLTGRGAVTVYDADDRPIGYVVQTSPLSDPIVGYSGPTNSLIAFDDHDRVIGVQILHSADTVEHVADVVQDNAFMSALVGRDWQGAGKTENVDAVSGASLTSLAILEGISVRLAGRRPSLRFPEELVVAELNAFFDNAAELVAQNGNPAVFDVVDASGQLLGSCLRTSPTADDEMGYQGPTDTLIVFDPGGKVLGIQVRKSYDNEPYVGYVRDEDYFLDFFNGRTMDELARLDPVAAGVEGVSGATMTSLAIAHGMSKATRAGRLPAVSKSPRFVWASRDSGTVLVIIAALLICFTNLRGVRSARICFQLLLIGYFGFLNGDLLSQALFVGWAQSGVPWRLAPGLVALLAIAFAVPALSKRQVYCHHICPFGAAQQLVRIGAKRRTRLAPWLVRALKLIPGLLLLLVVVTAMRHWPVNLAGIEPFDAFLFWIAGAASISVAVVGLLVSRFVPMAYCRFGCPTGAVLNYVRYHSRSDRLTIRDAIAWLLLVTAVVIRVL